MGSQLQQVWKVYETAGGAGIISARPSGMARVGELITRANVDAAGWAEVVALIGRRRRLVDSAHNRLVEALQVIGVETAWELQALVVEAVRIYVTDDDTLRAVAAEYERLVDQPLPRT